MMDHIPDPAGWNRIRELETELRKERGGREYERAGLLNALERITAAIEYLDHLEATRPDPVTIYLVTDIRGILTGVHSRP